jgi:hypothetical protein
MFFVGVDLGQKQDHTAIALVERLDRHVTAGMRSWREMRLGVRDMQRVPLGTAYPQVVERVREMVNDPELRGQCCVVVDGTGVGAPVVDMLRAARLGCEICEVTITSGERANQVSSGSGPRWNVPKQDLMTGVQVLLERGELKIAKRMEQAGALVRELLNVRTTFKANGRVRMGADACGEHDDLVIAVALACWRAGKMPGTGQQGGRLPGT